MLNDVHSSNKQAKDFKERLLNQQKKENQKSKLESRKKDEHELHLLKVKQKVDQMNHKKQYYEDLKSQNKMKTVIDNKNLTLKSYDLTKGSGLIDYSKTPQSSAMIPGINNLSTVGSSPLLRVGKNKTGEFGSAANYLTLGKMDPPLVPSARLSRYQKLKQLENEYYDVGKSEFS